MNLVSLRPAISPQAKKPILNSSQSRFSGQKPSVLTVQGVGTVYKVPDTVSVTMQIHDQAKTRREVASSLDDRSRRMIEMIKDISPNLRIKTDTHIGQHHEYNHQTHKNEKVGYAGRYIVTVTEQGDNLDELKKHASRISEIADETEANFNGPQFAYSKTQQAVLEAIPEAVKNLKETALTLAKALNVKLAKKPVSVSTGGETPSVAHAQLETVALAGAARQADAPVGVSPETMQSGLIPIQSPTVQAVFRILPKQADSLK